ncbi:uncharacterized protein LOC129770292 [Toxorhynchites rutilus septentrionalis]|uniref:uncharacterized protein LOC129770292 n=1 Tax=Toxorhynchites rutilus septentrionalis TaxID=329112 RepID=UPI0024784400|nr:uncharacterized protein LOC129770292 [Toxorhynchites rutilus septentrionalis]
MNVIRFKLPENFHPKTKVYRRKKISRCVWISPDTLFTLCEVVLRKLLLHVVPRQKFWPFVISLLPNETARSSVWHQVECPWDFNRPQHATVNYSNHWSLLSTAAQHQHKTLSNIRVGSLVRNKITQQLLLDLDYCSSSGSEYQQPQGSQYELTNRELYRMGFSSPENSACDCGKNCGQCKRNLARTREETKPVIQQLVILGHSKMQPARRGTWQMQINGDRFGAGWSQVKM